MSDKPSTASFVYFYYPPVWKAGVKMSCDEAAWMEEELEALRLSAMTEYIEYAAYYELQEELVRLASLNLELSPRCTATKLFEPISCDDIAACDRGWAYTSNGEVVRWLWVERYDITGRPSRSFVRRLDNDDPRPMGCHCSGHSLSTNDLIATLPIGAWSELVWK
jgi:hypothetical protein